MQSVTSSCGRIEGEYNTNACIQLHEDKDNDLAGLAQKSPEHEEHHTKNGSLSSKKVRLSLPVSQ